MAPLNWIQEKTQRAPATVNACLRELEQLEIVKEETGQKENRCFSYASSTEIMRRDTEGSR